MTLDQDKLVPTTLNSVGRENPAGPSWSSTSRKNSCTAAGSAATAYGGPDSLRAP